jgi:hypothetical protein
MKEIFTSPLLFAIAAGTSAGGSGYIFGVRPDAPPAWLFVAVVLSAVYLWTCVAYSVIQTVKAEREADAAVAEVDAAIAELKSAATELDATVASYRDAKK